MPLQRPLLVWAIALGLLLVLRPAVTTAGEGRRAPARQSKRVGASKSGQVKQATHRSLRRPSRRRTFRTRRWRREVDHHSASRPTKQPTRERGQGRTRRSRPDERVKRLPPPPYPEHFSGLGEFARRVLRFGSGDAAARERIKTLTGKELREAGFTVEMAHTWVKFLKNEKRRNPHNPSVRGRIELMERAIELLGARDGGQKAPVRRIWPVTTGEAAAR